MIPILTPDEAHALDRASAERAVPLDSLMERAGWAVARSAAALAGGTYGRRAVVVCGRGNNGGDGFVAARHLARWGMGVTVVTLPDVRELRGAAAASFRRFVVTDGRWLPFEATQLRRDLARADVAIDALFGTGFHGRAEGDAGTAIRAIGEAGAPVLAVDIPSGVDGATGEAGGDVVRADATVTFGALKPGLLFATGARLAGVVEVVDIGFPADLFRSRAGLVEGRDVAGMIRPRDPDAHKRSTGVLLVLAGSRTMTGAAILAASAAYRAGAGLVTIAVPESALAVIQRAVVEAISLPLPETASGTVSEAAWELLAERLEGVDAAAVGPGLSREPETGALIRRFVSDSPVPFVLDADGLNAFAGRASDLLDRRAAAVLTPHAGEFARLTDVTAEESARDPLRHTRDAAAAFDAVVLLKGPRTVVAEPSGRTWVISTGGPSLATGGTGDVLTGTIGALLARGLPSQDAAIAGAYVHGLAGGIAGADLGDGTTASDVLERLPQAVEAVRLEAG